MRNFRHVQASLCASLDPTSGKPDKGDRKEIILSTTNLNGFFEMIEKHICLGYESSLLIYQRGAGELKRKKENNRWGGYSTLFS